MTIFKHQLLRTAVLAVVVIAFAAVPAAAQFDLSVERALLVKLLRDGRYKQALAESRRIEEVLLGRTSAPAKGGKKSKVQPPAVTMALVELLIYRGTVERRMGNLDAAEKTLTEAYTQITNEDFQRMIRAYAPADKEALEKYLVNLKLPLLQLIDNGTEVLIDRLRTFNYERQAQAAAGTVAKLAPEQQEEIESLFRRIDQLVRVSMMERQIPLKVPREDPAAASPQAMMMLTQARPYRLIGMRYLEASRLSWTVPFDADPATMSAEEAAPEPGSGRGDAAAPDAAPARVETPVERDVQAKSQRLRAIGYLEKSRDLAGQAVDAARSGFQAEGISLTADAEKLSVADAEKRRAFFQEESRIRAETAIPLTVLAMLDGDSTTARALIDPAIEALSAAESPTHPEMARPLMISAELAMQEGAAAQGKKDFTGAQRIFKQAVGHLRGAKAILESADSEFDPESPLHSVLADLLLKSEVQQGQSRQIASATSAADAAARRALAALARSESAMTKPKPKPDAKPDAKSDEAPVQKKPAAQPQPTRAKEDS